MFDHPEESPEQLADRVGRHLYGQDPVSRLLGISLEAIGPGHARMGLTVTRDMLNSHGLLHGGITYTLADTAFAYACNSHGHNTVATGCTIAYPAPGREGDRLTAEAVETHLAGRSGVTDVTVTNQDGAVIALFRGQSRRVSGQVLGDGFADADTARHTPIGERPRKSTPA